MESVFKQGCSMSPTEVNLYSGLIDERERENLLNCIIFAEIVDGKIFLC